MAQSFSSLELSTAATTTAAAAAAAVSARRASRRSLASGAGLCHTACSIPPLPLSHLFGRSLVGLFATPAEAASLLCANSRLIQELFYAVKRTCDKEEG